MCSGVRITCKRKRTINKSWGGSKDGLMPRWREVQEEEKFNKQGGPQDRGDPDRQRPPSQYLKSRQL